MRGNLSYKCKYCPVRIWSIIKLINKVLVPFFESEKTITGKIYSFSYC